MAGAPLRRRRLLLAPTLLLALACSTPEERFAEHVSRAEGYLEEGRADDALIELQSALKIDPDDADVNLRLAELLRDRGSVQAAAFHFGETHRLDPTRVDAAVQQALLLWPTAPRRAQQIIAGAMRRFPENAEVHRGAATLAGLAGDLDAALASAQRATELAPEDPQSWAALGSVYVQRTKTARRSPDEEPDPADFTAGIAALDEVDALTGGHVGARVEKARLLGHRGRQDEAIAQFRSAIELAKGRDDAASVVYAAKRLAGYAGRLGSPDLEIEALRETVDAMPEAVRQWSDLSAAVERRDGPRAGEAVYRELVEQQAELPAAHVAFAAYLAGRGRGLDAIAHIDRTIAGGLDDPLLWEQLVSLELGEGRIADARATLAEMRSRHGGDPATRRSEARLAVAENRGEDALAILTEFAGEEETAETERLRALAERILGNDAAAAAAAQRAAALSPPHDTTALRLLASIHGDLGNWEAAIRILRRIRARSEQLTPLEQVLDARAHYEIGEDERGRELLEAVLSRPAAPPAAAVEFAQREPERADEARAHLRTALRFAPSNLAALSAITRLDLAQGRNAQALRRLDRLVEAQLAGPRVLLLRSQVLLHAGELDRAEADALRAFEAIPELSEAIDMLFTIYAAQDKIEEAARSFEEADSVGVLHKGARVLLARLYMAQDEDDKALALYEKVLAEDGQMVAAKHDLARLLADRGADLDRALALAEDARRAAPEDPAVADTLGYVYFLKERYDDALRQFRQALALARAVDIAPPAVHYHMGLALAELGRHGEAVNAFERALALDPGFQGADDARSRLEAARATTATGSS